MPNLTPDGLHLVSETAARHAFSVDVALSLLDSLVSGGGYQAQFNHPELGGMGQWSQGGMIMIGDMFNQNLKYRVGALCDDLANLLRNQPIIQAPVSHVAAQASGGGVSLFTQGGSSGWWPSELGSPSSSGSQNDMRYAFFPGARRLAIQQGGRTRLFDTLNHQLSGFSQQQGYDQSVTFQSQFGPVRVLDLPEIADAGHAPHPASSSYPEPVPPGPAAPASHPERIQASAFAAAAEVVAPAKPALGVDEILKIIEGLASLRDKGILSEVEFSAKKSELLARL